MKAQYYVYLVNWGNPRASNRLMSESFPCSASGDKVPKPNKSHHGVRQGPAYPWIVSFSSLAAWGNIPASQSHPFVGTRGHLILLIFQGLSPTAPWWFTGFPSTTSVCFWGAVWCSLPLGCEDIWLISCCWSHLSHVWCHGFGHPHDPGVGTPPSPMEWRDDSNNFLKRRLNLDMVSFTLRHNYLTKNVNRRAWTF